MTEYPCTGVIEYLIAATPGTSLAQGACILLQDTRFFLYENSTIAYISCIIEQPSKN
jgi:hypothetical protein